MSTLGQHNRSTATRLLSHRFALHVIFVGLALVSTALNAADQPAQAGTLHLGFSSRLLQGLNAADARASIRALAAAIAKEHEIMADPEPVITTTIDQSAAALSSGKIDALSMSLEEYHAIRTRAPCDRFMLATFAGDPTETYLILVNNQSPINTLRDLSHRKIFVLTGARMCLSIPWLDIELRKQNLPALSHLVSTLTETTKATQAILPVFFRQADACLVTQRAYETVVELNPQIGRELHTLAASPHVIPSLFAFRSGYPTELKDRSISVFANLHTTVHGQQTLLIFQSSRVAEFPDAALASSLSLLDEHEQICPEEAKARLRALQASGTY